MNNNEEQKLLQLIWDREECGLAMLQEQFGSFCFAIANRIVCNCEDAKECVNDTWLNTWQSIPPNRPENFKGYIAKITRNIALHKYIKEHAKKRAANQYHVVFEELEECLPGKNSIEEILDNEHLLNVIKDFLERQSRKKRVIFIQRYFYVMDINEISDLMGIKNATISSILFRLRADLTKELEKEGIHL